MIAFKDAETMVTDMINYAVAKGCPVTDYNQGAPFRVFFEVVAWVISGFSGEVRADWETALKDFIYKVFEFSKKEGTKASTTVTFSTSTPATVDIQIIIGSLVKTSDDKVFETVTAGTILTGQTTSNLVQVTSVEVGLDKNVDADTITVLVTNLLSVTGVINGQAAQGGTDGETDNQLQQRFAEFVSNLARSTIYGYVSGAKSVEGVKYAYVVEDLGEYAITQVVFHANTPPTQDLVIPKGTRLRTATNIYYMITVETTILQGQNDSVQVAARAVNRGVNGNNGVGTIIYTIDAITGVDTVNNPIAATGGTDGELGKVSLFTDDGSGSVTQTIFDEVIKVIEGDANDRENYPGYRAAGTVISYQTPNIVSVSVTQTVYVEEGTDSDEVKVAVETAQSTYINNLSMGENVVIESLTAAALTVDGVKDIGISVPTTNVVISTIQIAKPGVYTTTVTGFVG